MPIDRTDDQKIGIRAFQRVVDWLRQSGGAMDAALLKRAFDLLRSNQRARRVVHCDVIGVSIDSIQASPNRILPTFTAGHDRANFFEPCTGRDSSNFIVPLFTRNEDNFVDTISAFERADCVTDNWFARDYSKQFIETHALAAAARYDDG